MKGLVALIYLREHFFPSTWQQLPDAFARMYELGTQFSDMTVNRFYGNFTEFCKILQDEVDAFEREYGAIDSALFVRLQLLQAIFTSSHDHIVAFRKLGMEKGDITSHDLNFRDASGKVTDLAAMLREHERSRPDVHVWDKTPKSECEARRLMQERTVKLRLTWRLRSNLFSHSCESCKRRRLALLKHFTGLTLRGTTPPSVASVGFLMLQTDPV